MATKNMDGDMAFIAKTAFGSFIERAKKSAQKNITRLAIRPIIAIKIKENFIENRIFPYLFNANSLDTYRDIAKGRPDVIRDKSIM